MGCHIRVSWVQVKRQVAEARESNTMVRELIEPASTMWTLVSGSNGPVAKLVRFSVVVVSVLKNVCGLWIRVSVVRGVLWLS